MVWTKKAAESTWRILLIEMSNGSEKNSSHDFFYTHMLHWGLMEYAAVNFSDFNPLSFCQQVRVRLEYIKDPVS